MPLYWTLLVILPTIGAVILVMYVVLRRVDKTFDDEEVRRRARFWPFPHTRF